MDIIQDFINHVFLHQPESCKTCLGCGKLSREGKLSNLPIICPVCNGTGKEPVKKMNLSHEEIEQLHFECCEGCNRFNSFWDSDCRELCDGWEKAVKQYECEIRKGTITLIDRRSINEQDQHTEELQQKKQSVIAYLRELHIIEDKLKKIETYIDSCLALSEQPGEKCPSGMTVTTKIKSILNYKE